MTIRKCNILALDLVSVYLGKSHIHVIVDADRNNTTRMRIHLESMTVFWTDVSYQPKD